MPAYFSDRQRGPRPRTNETIDAAVWGGIYATVSALLSNGSFGHAFPETCPDGYGVIGHDSRSLELMLKAQHPDMPYPLPLDQIPETMAILDFLEFVAASIGKPIEGSFHSFFRHHHLSFDHNEGLREFVNAVNTIFARNGVAYELTNDGEAKRILAAELQQLFATTSFHSGDGETDRLLEEARADFTSPRENVRRGALEKLWDAFERIKTLEPGPDKRAQVTALLDKTAKGKFRVTLEAEATELTRIGNTFRIRHSETSQEPLAQSGQSDYLFHRMFSFLRLVLTATGRAN
jgi:AbiJ N-terminal domain 4